MNKKNSEKKVIIVGASSGIGRELAKLFAIEGYEVGIVARRMDLLLSLQKEVEGKFYIKQVDISNTSKAIPEIESLIHEMGEVDLAILNAGTGFINPDFDWEKDKHTIEVNVLGFCAMANVFMKHFYMLGKGHLVGISSIAALRGSGVYSATKAFVSNYLEGLRHKTLKEKKVITITDIKPGFVDTAMAKGDLFWVAPVDKAAKEIYQAIIKKKTHAYITSRWRLVAWALKCMPRFIYDRFF